MRRKERFTRTFYRYTAIYFVMLFLISALVFLFVMRYSSGRLISLETESAQRSMQLTADTLEKQFQTLENIAVKVSTTAAYQPNMITRGPTYDMELLNSFSQFANYSPLAEQYFLMYRMVNKIYLSSGHTSYFDVYAPLKLDIPVELTAEALTRILNSDTLTFERSGDYVIIVFPIQFYGLDRTGAYNASLCFALRQDRLAAYISQISAGLPERFAVTLNGCGLYQHGEIEADALRTVSKREKVILTASPDRTGWQLLFFQDGPIFYGTVAAILLSALLIAFLMAHFSLKPLEKLIRKYTPESERVKNDFRQLDEILENMEAQQSSVLYQLRNHYLVMMLRGDYSDKLAQRWAMLNIKFKFDTCCVFLIRDGAAGERREVLGRELQNWQHPQIRFFTAEMEEDTSLIVVANYDHSVSEEEILGRIRAAVNKDGLTVYAGKPTDSPKRLPISFMAALTASQYGVETPTKQLINSDSLAEGLLTAVLSRNEEAMDRVCARIRDYLSEDKMDSILTKHRFYELMSSILHKAEEQDIPLPKAEINALVLLPDPALITQDLKRILQAADLSGKPEDNADETATLIVEYIIVNAYDPDLNLQDMSDRFGLSADYISAMVKKETGSAFKEYVTLLRISEARRLLMEDNNLTVNDVALRVGYRKASNFSKKFKELTGVLPSQIR